MIDLSSATKRQTVNQPRKHNPMSKRVSTPKPQVENAPVSLVVLPSRPHPARRSIPSDGRINVNFREDPNQVFGGETIYGKILLSHCEKFLSSLVEPFQTVYGGSLYYSTGMRR